MVAERKVAVGDVAQPGQALATLYDPGRLQIEGEVNDNYREQVKIGEIAQVSVPAVKFEAGSPHRRNFSHQRPGQPHLQGAHRDAEQPGPDAGDVRAVVPPPGAQSRGILIPKAAVDTVGQLTMVKVAVEKTAQLRQVKLGQALGDQVEVLAGLQARRPDYGAWGIGFGSRRHRAACGRRKSASTARPIALLVPKLLLGNVIVRQAPLGRPQMGRNPMGGAKQSFAAREVPKQELGNQKKNVGQAPSPAHGQPRAAVPPDLNNYGQ